MEKYQEVERSIIKKYRKDIWSKFVKAVKEYYLINEGDKVMVCISGGKDSFLMAKCIQEIKRHGKINFEAKYVVMNPGYNEKNKELILKNDKQRASYYNYYTCKKWGDTRSYDLMLNTSKLSVDDCVDLIIDFRKHYEKKKAAGIVVE